MSNNRDDKPAYIFCSAETKAEMAKRFGADTPPDNVFVVADVIPFGFCVVTTKDDFMGWLFARGNDHDIWTIPEEELRMNHDYAHCIDYSSECPKECFRGKLLRDLRNNGTINLIGVPIAWSHLKGTANCAITKKEETNDPNETV